MRNERLYSTTIHLIDEKIDQGRVILQDFDIFPDKAKIPNDFFEHSKERILKQYCEFIKNLNDGGKFLLTSSSKYIGDYYPRLSTKVNGWIDWSWNPEEIERFINAFDEPYEGAKTFLYETEVKILDTRLSGSVRYNHSFVNGIVTNIYKDFVIVQVSKGQSLIIKMIKNKKGENILNKIKLGDRFYTPSNKLDSSKKRVFYN